MPRLVLTRMWMRKPVGTILELGKGVADLLVNRMRIAKWCPDGVETAMTDGAERVVVRRKRGRPPGSKNKKKKEMR